MTTDRKGKKATQEKVFAACEQLRFEQGDFRNEDVVALTGGSVSTVAPLVRMFRQYEHVIAANDTLDAKTTLDLVAALDGLLKQQLGRSQQAIEDFQHAAGVEIAELGGELEDERDARLAAEEALAETRVEIEQLRRANQELTSDVRAASQATADAETRVRGKELEITNTINAHTAKLEQLNAEHQTHLTTSLEAQRKALTAEAEGKLNEIQKSYQQELGRERSRLEESESRSRDTIAAQEATILSLRVELDGAQTSLASAEKQVQLAQNQTENQKVLLKSIEKDKQRLVSVIEETQAQGASELRAAMSSVQTGLESIQTNVEAMSQRLTVLERRDPGE